MFNKLSLNVVIRSSEDQSYKACYVASVSSGCGGGQRDPTNIELGVLNPEEDEYGIGASSEVFC